MKYFVVFAALSSAPFLATAAQAAANCDHSFTFNSGVYSLLFNGDDGAYFSDSNVPATCVISESVAPVAAGEIVAYKADYRGSLYPSAEGELKVDNAGRTTTTTFTTGDDFLDYFTSDFVGTSDGNLDSTITLRLRQHEFFGSEFTLDTIDYLELARTTTADIQAASDEFAANHTSLITHLNGTADLLTGAGEKLDAPDHFGPFAAIGSFNVGVTGRKNLDNGLSLQGGAAAIDQSAGGASARGLLFSGSLRYLTPDSSMFRPFVEVGLTSAPVLDLTFTRHTKTSAGTQTSTGTALGMTFGGYLKGGVLVAPDASNEIVFSASIGKDWLHTGAYTEAVTASSLFAATAAAQDSSFDTAKAGIDWTTAVTPDVEVTLSGALGATIAENDVTSDVAFAGSFNGAAKTELFAQYGARATYALDPASSIGGFVHGTTGQYSGTHIQVGGTYHVRF